MLFLKGKLLNIIKLKAKNVTICTLDNYRKNTLYVTTAYKNLKVKILKEHMMEKYLG